MTSFKLITSGLTLTLFPVMITFWRTRVCDFNVRILGGHNSVWSNYCYRALANMCQEPVFWGQCLGKVSCTRDPRASNYLRELWMLSCWSPTSANTDSSNLAKCQTQGRSTSPQSQLKPSSWNPFASFPGSFLATQPGPAGVAPVWHPLVP